MTQSADVAIVGAGVVGLTVAYELLRRGTRVTLLERGEPGRAASWAGAGIIAPGNPARARLPDDRLRAESAARWPSLADELTALTGLPTGYRRCGGYEHVAEVDPAWSAEGIEYEYSTEHAGYFFPGMAQVRNPWLLRALVAAVTQLGGTIRTQCEVTGWQRDGDRVVAAETNQGLVPAGEYLVCGGAWSERLLGPGAAVFPVRGQIVAYRIPEGGPAHIHVWDKQYLVPRGDGLVLAGSTEELVGFDASTTDDGIRGLREFAESHWPALRGATVEATWAGLRPGSRDNRPTLGRVPGYRNVSVATGHFRAGVQLSPATGRLMAELLTGREPFIPLDSFRPDRPAGPPARPAFRS